MLALIAAYLIIFIAFAYFIWVLSRSGLFDTIDVSVNASPPIFSKSITIYYKHHLGPYNRLSAVYQEAKSMIPNDGMIFGIYYDDPEEVKENVLQSAVGVIFGEEGKDYYSEEYSKKLAEWGYERMVLPKIDKAVVATQRFEGYFSLFTLLNFTYPKINFFLKRNNYSLPAHLALEIYSDQQVQILIPLDHQQDFIVPEVLITAEKLAQRNGKIDSETESTTTSSESALEEEQDSMLVAGGDAGNDGGNAGNDGGNVGNDGGNVGNDGGGDGDDDDVKVETTDESDKKNV